MHVSHRSSRSASRRLRAAAVLTVASVGLAACGASEVASTPAPSAAPEEPSDDTAPEAVPTETAMPVQAPHDEDAAPAHETMETSHDLAVALDVTADAKAGWNVHVEASGFTWAPEDANTEAVDGAGHAHLYIDGEKWGRVYTPWLHVSPDLAAGTHTFRVTLNANDHRDYAIDGEVVAATTTVEVPEPAESMGHVHDEVMETTTDMAVTIEAVADARQGVNVHVAATGFTWAPQHASSDAIDGEGHAHLYLDGEKVGRLYGEWFHVGRDLAPGEHEVRVTLNANDHRDYAIDGELVEAVVTVTVPS